MAYEAQTYDKTRNANAAGKGGLEGALGGFATGASIGAAAGAVGGAGIGAIPGALIGGLIGAATVGAGSAGASAWTDDAAQKQEIAASEKSVASAKQMDKDMALDTQAMTRAAPKPSGLPAGSAYMPTSAGNTGYDAWKSQLRGY